MDIRVILGLTFVAGLHFVLRRAYHSFARLTDRQYSKDVLCWEALKSRRRLTFLVGLTLMLAPFWRVLSWDRFCTVYWLRPFIVSLTICTWAFAGAYGHNWLLKRWHAIDRAFLLILCALAVTHPLFLVPFVGLAFVMMFQFIETLKPIFVTLDIYAHKTLFLDLLVAFISWLSLNIVVEVTADVYFIFSVSLVTSSYVYSAIGKLRINWPKNSDLVGLLSAAIAHGWWSLSSISAISGVGRWIEKFNAPLLFACLALEAGSSLTLASRSFAFTMLASLALFHCLVLLLSGINFLPWALLDFMLLVASRYAAPTVFGFAAVGYTMLLLAFAKATLCPLELVWLDSRLCSAYEFVAVSISGKHRVLSPTDFAPYDLCFAVGKFRFMSNELLMVDAWAETLDRRVVAGLRTAKCAIDVKHLENRFGLNYYSVAPATQLEHLLTAFLATRRQSGFGGTWLAKDWLANTTNALDCEDIERIDIRLIKVMYALGEFSVIERRVVHSVSRAHPSSAKQYIMTV